MTHSNDKLQTHDAVLVVGGGIGGMQSALLLAQAGHRVYLLDSGPAIGGSMHLLDRTFPTDSCGICHMLPGRAAYCPTFECQLHPNIEILPYAEVVELEGEPGAFTVQVRHKPRYVSVERCIDCGLCVPVCPVERPSQYEGALHKEKAIYRPPLRAVPGAYVIDPAVCIRCGKCAEVCPTGAVDLDMQPVERALAVGAVILSPGFEPFDARLKGEFGFGHYDNVVTSIQFERMVSLAGSTGAHIVRPSDGKLPRRIAFIQCVGSRDVSIGRGYCSSVCCMHTAKQVKVAKSLEPDLGVTVFYMDIRAHGKDFDAYFEGVEALPGVEYRRSMVSAVHQLQQSRNLLVNFIAEDGSPREEEFDMVVLVVGFGAPAGVQALGEGLGVALNDYGFGVNDPFAPEASSRPGVFLGGAFREPKDIPETVVEASAAAASAARLLRPNVGQADSLSYVERDVTWEAPRVGVFLYDCGGQLAGLIDLEAVAAHARSLPNVALAQVVDGGFAGEGLAAVSQAVRTENLNRVLLAGCTDLRLQAAFRRMMEAASLNFGLLEQVNLRGEVVWGGGNGRSATARAQQLVAMGVAGALRRQPFRPPVEELGQRVLVIGGGLAGLTAALTLADMGVSVDLVERSDTLGGQLRHLRLVAGGGDPQQALTALLERVSGQPRIHVHLNTTVQSVSGRLGQFRARLAPTGEGEPFEETYGAVIVATGGQPVVPSEYLYGQDPRVMTQRELEAWMADSRLEIANSKLQIANSNLESAISNLRSVVMIQCVESREPQRPYCSRVCCTKAVLNALALKERNPETSVTVLYREMRTYGFREDLYRQAREKGVVFLRYDLEHKPRVSGSQVSGFRLAEPATPNLKPETLKPETPLEVRLVEPITGQEVTLPADLLVLSTGIAAGDNGPLAAALGVELDGNGFFREEHPKMRPLDFTQRGVFVCGLAHSPRGVDETIAMAQGAAMRAVSLLAPGQLEAQRTVATVNTRTCSACGLCVQACPYGARVLEPGALYAEVIEALCQGCGTCAMVCPNKATQQVGFVTQRIYAMLDAVTMS